MLGLINTRPAWNCEKDLWFQDLSDRLSGNFEILNVPQQVLKLLSYDNVLEKIYVWLKSVKVENEGYLVFTSPATVRALGMYLNVFESQQTGGQVRFKTQPSDISNVLAIKLLKQTIRLACVGSGTKLILKDLLETFIPDSIQTENLIEKTLSIDINADSYSFVRKFEKNFENKSILLFQGLQNKPFLYKKLQESAKNVEVVSLYSREKTSLPLLQDFIKLIHNKNYGSKSQRNFEKKIFLLLTSTQIARFVISEIVNQKIDLNSFIIVSHHEKIIENIKKEFKDVDFVKILSLAPEIIAEKISNYYIL